VLSTKGTRSYATNSRTEKLVAGFEQWKEESYTRIGGSPLVMSIDILTFDSEAWLDTLDLPTDSAIDEY
jgi:hypothetical protein